MTGWRVGSSLTDIGTTSTRSTRFGTESPGRFSHGGNCLPAGVASAVTPVGGGDPRTTASSGAGSPAAIGTRAWRYSWARLAVSAVTGTWRPRARWRRSAALSIAVPIRQISFRRSRPPCRSGSLRWVRSRAVSTRSTRWRMGTSFASWRSRTNWRMRGAVSLARPVALGIPSVRSRTVTEADSQLWIRFACRSPAASPRATRISASESGICSVNSWRFVFGCGRKYGNARIAPRAMREAGRTRIRSRIACIVVSHWSLATSRTGSVDPRWNRNPSPTTA